MARRRTDAGVTIEFHYLAADTRFVHDVDDTSRPSRPVNVLALTLARPSARMTLLRAGDSDPASEEAVHAAQEVRQIAGVSLGQDQLLLALDAPGESLLQAQPSGGDVDQDAPAVAQILLAVEEVVGDHPVDQPGQARGGNQHELGELGHRVTRIVGEEHERPPLLHRAAFLVQHTGEMGGQ
jgi:hypothetical protein